LRRRHQLLVSFGMRSVHTSTSTSALQRNDRRIRAPCCPSIFRRQCRLRFVRSHWDFGRERRCRAGRGPFLCTKADAKLRVGRALLSIQFHLQNNPSAGAFAVCRQMNLAEAARATPRSDQNRTTPAEPMKEKTASTIHANRPLNGGTEGCKHWTTAPLNAKTESAARM